MTKQIPAAQVVAGDYIKVLESTGFVEVTHVVQADHTPYFIRFYLNCRTMDAAEYKPTDLVTMYRPYPPMVAELVRLVYPRQWNRAHPQRTAILQRMFPACKSDNTLPRNPGLAVWEYNAQYFRLLPFNPDPRENNRHQGKARFQVQCPECKNWYSVGKYMLHSRVHIETAMMEEQASVEHCVKCINEGPHHDGEHVPAGQE